MVWVLRIVLLVNPWNRNRLRTFLEKIGPECLGLRSNCKLSAMLWGKISSGVVSLIKESERLRKLRVILTHGSILIFYIMMRKGDPYFFHFFHKLGPVFDVSYLAL
jgi:hypothetical protein